MKVRRMMGGRVQTAGTCTRGLADTLVTSSSRGARHRRATCGAGTSGAHASCRHLHKRITRVGCMVPERALRPAEHRLNGRICVEPSQPGVPQPDMSPRLRGNSPARHAWGGQSAAQATAEPRRLTSVLSTTCPLCPSARPRTRTRSLERLGGGGCYPTATGRARL